MSDLTASDRSHSLACPHCRTMVNGSHSVCPTCNLSLEWIERFPEFGKALSIPVSDCDKRTIGWSLCLHVKVVWAGGHSEWDELIDDVSGAIELSLTQNKSIRLELSDERDRVKFQHSGQTEEVILPGQKSLSGLDVTCWLTADAPEESQVTDIEPPRHLEPLGLKRETEVCIGRAESSTLQLHHSRIALDHCVIVRQPQTDIYWIVDTGTEYGTFVNRKRIASARLLAGDLVGIGPFVWTFNNEDGFLIPVSGIEGVTVDVKDLQVAQPEPLLKSIWRRLFKQGKEGHDKRLERLHISEFRIDEGQFVAITGPSGSGKSTFLKALAGLPDSRTGGHILVDGRDIDKERAWFREILAYVPQQQIVHSTLSARLALRYSAKLRGAQPDTQHVNRMLYQVELKDSRWGAALKELSGGEAKRVCTAVELISEPKLLLLDEPGSGLDREREIGLMKLLRSLSLRGCTVVIVTHNVDLADSCDRLVVIKDGQVSSDGPPARFKGGHRTEHVRRQGHITEHPQPSSLSDSVGNQPTNHSQRRKARRPFATQAPGGLKQFLTLVGREWNLVKCNWFRRLFVPALIVPAIFAVSLGFAIKPTGTGLLSFFSVLACIWMGASLSLLSIVGERSIFDHERHLFLRIPSYVLAKFLLLAVVSTVQTVVFLGLLWFLRWWLEADMLINTGFLQTMLKVTPALCIVGWAAVASGLVISALANASRETANFLLPLFMIAQIVFSVPITMGTYEDSLSKAYEQLHGRMCAVSPECQRRAMSRLHDRDKNFWLCDRCCDQYKERQRDTDDSPKKASPEQILDWVRNERAKKNTPLEDRQENRNRPNRVASVISYATLSRYGDIMLRSFAYHRPPSDSNEGDQNVRWMCEALVMLLVFLVAQLSAIGLILSWQSGKGRLALRDYLQNFQTRTNLNLKKNET